ncbi:D-alanyl-D-alanine carboxypeptidase family protein [Paenibacillus sp. R14(2021)]|uniref:M15 family metallopeptidase n=1 Tax=Paenibacillus sp. R14(2021) TaxID=2859228 RepID=UPI002157AB3D|nr:M15 family metallopeptidase [Paenibacillus sp. R14(2021)]
MKKSILIPVVVLGLALGAAFISTHDSLIQDVFGNPAAASTGGGKTSTPPTKSSSQPASAQTGTDSSQAAGSQSALAQFLHDNAPSRTIVKRDGIAYVTNSTSPLVLVNKKRELESTYVPSDLVKVNIPFSFSGANPKQQLRKVAAQAMEKLVAGAKKDGIDLKGVSGYRSYASQKAIFSAYAKTHGEEEANTFSAHPGQSEHQTGLSMDVSSASVQYGLEQSYGETKEGKWLKAHAADYGFIIRYEKGSEKQTGYMYEPWHVRYVGVYIAKDIKKLGVTLEAYLARF